MSEIICPKPWNSINILPDGTVRMCCKVPYLIKNSNGPMSVYQHSYQEIWNCEYMQKLRKSILNNEKVIECNYCYLAEAAGKNSDRLKQLKITKDFETNPIADLPVVVELDLGNYCNLKCRMCNPTASSSIENDKIHTSWRPLPNYGKKTKDQKHWSTNKELIFGQIFSKPDRIVFLQFAGGEPMLSKTMFDIIEFLATNNYSKNISLNITTNGTTFNRKLLDYLPTFKKIDFGISVEGIGRINEYIRYPSRWENIQENLGIMRSLKNANVYLATVVQIYNLIYIKEIIEYADQNNLPAYFETLNHPPFLQPNLLPEEILHETIAQLSSYIDTKHKNEIEYVIKTIKSRTIPNKEELFKDFMLFTNDLDKSRGQSLRESLPELYEKLIKSGVQWNRQTKYTQPKYA